MILDLDDLLPTVEQSKLTNGLELHHVKTTTPIVSLRLLLKGGARHDPLGRRGLASLTSELLVEAAGDRDAESFAAYLDDMGIEVSADASSDRFELSIRSHVDSLDLMLDVLADLLMRAALPRDGFDRLKALALDDLAARDDEPADVADDAMLAAVYGSRHPFGTPIIGTLRGVERVTLDDCRNTVALQLRPRGAVLCAVSQLDATSLAAALEARLSKWTGDTRIMKPVPKPKSVRHDIALPQDGAEQAEIRVATWVPRLPRSEWTALSLGSWALGGSTITGRIGAELREKRGWTYGARASLESRLGLSLWCMEAAIDGEHGREALNISEALIDAMIVDLRDEELETARRAAAGGMLRAFETPEDLLDRLAELAALGKTVDAWRQEWERISTTRLPDVKEAVGKWLGRERRTTVIVGRVG